MNHAHSMKTFGLLFALIITLIFAVMITFPLYADVRTGNRVSLSAFDVTPVLWASTTVIPNSLFSFSYTNGDVQNKILRNSPFAGNSIVSVQSPVTPETISVWPNVSVQKTYEVLVTAYSSTVDQTDADPFTTASGTRVRDGIVATNFLPMGSLVRFPDLFGEKIFVVQDRMNKRYLYTIDIWFPSREQAKQFGVKTSTVEIVCCSE